MKGGFVKRFCCAEVVAKWQLDQIVVRPIAGWIPAVFDSCAGGIDDMIGGLVTLDRSVLRLGEANPELFEAGRLLGIEDHELPHHEDGCCPLFGGTVPRKPLFFGI